MTEPQAKTRDLSDSFFNDLKDDKALLNPLLSFVKADNTLMLAIRNNYINIYYRGGSILRLFWAKDHQYNTEFDPNYVKNWPSEAQEIILTEDIKNLLEGDSDKKLPKKITNRDDVRRWLAAFPTLKQIMDIWLTTVKEKLEREFQQLVVRENNFSRSANMTDYFIVDIEASYPDLGACFDLLSVKWPPKDRKKDKVSLAFIEMKYGKDSLIGGAGLAKHLKDFETFIQNSDYLPNLRPTIERQLKRLNELGLLKHKRTENRDFEVTIEKPEVILLLAGYPLQSQRLYNLLFNAEEKDDLARYAHQDAPFDLKFHWPHSAGYSLFSVDMIPLKYFKERLHTLIFSGKSPTP